MNILERIFNNTKLKNIIAILSVILILSVYVQLNILSNSLYYSQHTPKSKVENVAGIMWMNHLKLTKVKKMRYRRIEYGSNTVEIHLGKYAHNYFPKALLKKGGDVYITFFRGDERYIYKIDKNFNVPEKSIYFTTEDEPSSRTEYDITKKESEEVLRIYNMLITPILKEARKPVINIQWLFNWEYENNII